MEYNVSVGVVATVMTAREHTSLLYSNNSPET